MIRVTFRPAVGECIEVEVPDGRELAVLQRAHARVFPGPVDPKAEAESGARFRAAMADLAARARAEKKAAAK